MSIPTGPLTFVDPGIDPVLNCDLGDWEVDRDETCLFQAPSSGPRGYDECRQWCEKHGYGWLPIVGDGGPPAERKPAD